MKKCFAIALAALTVFAACTKEGGVKTPTVSFETAQPLTIDGAATLSLKVSDYTGTEAVTVPVKFAGDAVKGDDYSVSAEAFVIGGSEPVTTITVTPVVYGSKKSVSASLEIPEGFAAGSYTSCSFTLSDALARCSFATSSTTLVSTLSIEVNLIGNDDKAYSVQDVEEIAVEVDTEKSTAVEGTDFRFKEDKKAVVFDAMKSTGKVEIEYIETAENAGKTVVLKLAPSNKYEIGQYGTVTVKLLGSFLGKLGGTWVMNEIVTDADALDELGYWSMYYDNPSMYEGLPQFNAEDKITFDVENLNIIPEFKSEYKNYFYAESPFILGEMYKELHTANDRDSVVDCQILIFSNINRYFSSTEFSEDKEGYVGFRFSTDENNNEILNMYVIDFESKTFLANELADPEMGWYNATKPTCTMTGTFLIANFKRAE